MSPGLDWVGRGSSLPVFASETTMLVYVLYRGLENKQD